MNRSLKLNKYVSGAVLAVVVAVVFKMSRQPLGIRNNNPGNIRRTGDQWLGAAVRQDDPQGYVVFNHPVYGIRAIAKILITYRDRYGLNTISGIISRWAPERENNTAAYIANMASWAGIDPDEPVNWTQDMAAIIRGIIRQENGKQPYGDELISRAIYLAYQ
jgi:hypothetical protein